MKYFFGEIKRLNEIFASIFGVGKSRSSQLRKEVGICSETITLKLNNVSTLRNERMDLKLEDFVIGDTLKQQLVAIFSKYKQAGCYRNVRVVQHLPCRGQRTKTNSKTAKRLNHCEIEQNVVAARKKEQKKEPQYKNKNKLGGRFKYGKTSGSDIRNLKRLVYSRKLRFGDKTIL